MTRTAGISPHSLPDGHVILILMKEHEHILKILDQLDDLRSKVASLISREEDPEVLGGLRDLTQQLIQMKSHYRREEEVLFPAIQEKGVIKDPYNLRLKHEILRDLLRKLAGVFPESKNMNFLTYEARVHYFTRSISRLWREHIDTEEKVIFPMALKVIENDSDWEELKAKCDEIGYGSFDSAE